MDDFSQILRSPIREDSSTRRFLILIGLALISWLVIPFFILSGYYAKNASHENGLVPIESYLELFLTGLKLWAGTALMYMFAFLPAMILGMYDSSIATAGAVLSVFLFLSAIFYRSAMVVEIGRNGSFREGFSKETLSSALSLNYLKAWIAAIGFSIGVFIAMVVVLITIIGMLMVPVLLVYARLVSWRIFGYFLNREK